MPIFYKLDSTRATFREYSYGTPWVLMPVAALIKLLRIRLPGSTDDPAVDSVASFEVEETQVPQEVLERFQPLTQELVELGFGRPIYHAIHEPIQYTRIYWATFLHETGQAVARIHYRVWTHPNISKTYLFPVFISEMDDGSFLVSSAGKPDLIAPEMVQLRHRKGASAAELWEFHNENLNGRLPRQSVSLKTHERVRAMIERLHAALRDFHLDRGVFQPLSEAEQEKLAAADVTTPSQTGALSAETTAPSLEQEVLENLERTQNKRSSWWSFVLVLGISLLLFVGAGGMDKSFLWLLIPILLFHELGHYLAMRVFGYRNVKMFFVPFLGAAVMGKHYNVPGWKKAIVALMGPVPGIIIGAGLGVGGLLFHQTKVTEAALLMIVLNGFNLLPFLPLDGGWVVHAVLFCRHPLLDVGFRLAAILGVFGLSILLHDRLYLLGIAMLIGLPAVWRTARVAQRLRGRGEVAASPDDASIPLDAVKPIVAELTAGKQIRPPLNLLSVQVSSVFETLNARPPGVAASLALLAVHGGSFVAAIVFAIVLMVGRHGFPWNRRATTTAETPRYPYVSGSTRHWHGAAEPAIPPRSPPTIIASYSEEETARGQFAALPAELPAAASLRLFGQTLILTLPDEKAEGMTGWSDRLKKQTHNVIVTQKLSFMSVRLSCVAPSEEEAKYLEEELHLYSRSRNPMILAPWSAAWHALPEEARQRFQKARRTFDRFENIRAEVARHPEVKALRNKVNLHADTMNNTELEEAKESLQRLRRTEEQRLVADLEAEGEKTVDHAMLDLCKRHRRLMKDTAKIDEEADEEAPEAKAWVQQMAVLDLEMAQHMGALPLKGEKPEPGSDLVSGHPGRISRQGRALSIDKVSFRDISRGLPALAEWLCQHGCSEVAYSIHVRNFPGGEEDVKGP